MDKRRKALFLGLTALTAFVARILPYQSAFLGGNVIFVQPDAYYHLRRATLIVKNFPFCPTLDRYMAYPYGAESPWPPLYDWVIAAISMIVGLGRPGDGVILTVTTLLPPVIGALTVIPVFLVARHLFGERTALFAAAFAVVMPGQLSYSIIGSGDHHTAEVFLLLYIFHYFLTGRADEKAPVRANGYRREVVSGLFLAVAILVWQGSLVFGSILAAYVAARFVAWKFLPPKEGDDPQGVLAGATVVLLTAAPVAAAARWLIPPGTEQGVFDFGFFSYFQPVYLVLLAGGLQAFARLLSLGGKDARKGAWILAGGAGIVVVVSILAMPGMGKGLLDGLRFLLRKHPYLESISEFQPLFAGSPLLDIFKGRFYPRQFWEALYVVGFFLPPYVLWAVWRDRKSAPWGSREWFFAGWTIIFFSLTLLQRRWGNAYAANVAIGMGWFFARIFERSKIATHGWREFIEWKEAHRGEKRPNTLFARVFVFSNRSPWIVASLAMFFFLIPYQQLLYSFLAMPGPPIDADLYNSLIWLRENTPKTSNLYEPTKQPEYSVLAEWDMGHWIQYIAERPTVANNYGYQLRGDGLGDSIRFAAARSEEEAVRICEKRGVRYIFATESFYPMMDLGKVVGVDYRAEHGGPEMAHPGEGPAITLPKESFYSLFYQRMYYFDGTMNPDNAALTRFRLVFESKNPNGFPHSVGDVRKVKIYEFVRGATIKGKAPPGAYVTCGVRLMTNWDRPFEFVAGTYSDDRGRFTLRVPYASKGSNNFVRPISRFLAISGGGAAKFFDVSNEDVLEGRTVDVDLTRGVLTPERHRVLREKGTK